MTFERGLNSMEGQVNLPYLAEILRGYYFASDPNVQKCFTPLEQQHDLSLLGIIILDPDIPLKWR